MEEIEICFVSYRLGLKFKEKEKMNEKIQRNMKLKENRLYVFSSFIERM